MNDYTPQPRRRPGRPTNEEIAARQAAPAPEPKRAEETRAVRRRRKDTGAMAGLKLHVPEDMKEPGFEYRWINDDGRRIHAKTVDDDWDIVTTKGIDGTGEGTPVTRRVGRQESGAGQNAILCRKPLDWYKEDKRKEHRVVEERRKAMERGLPPAPDGLTAADHSYIPDRHDGFSSGQPGQNRITKGG